MRLALVAFVGLLAAQPGPGSGGAAMRGNAFLRNGSNEGAVASFRSQLERTPDAPALHVGLGKALARIGRCEEALEHLEPWVGTRPFGHEAGLAAGLCAARLGLVDDARYYYEIAVEDEPDSARAWTAIALLAEQQGDTAARDAALDELFLVRDSRDASWYAQAAITLRSGALDRFDVIVAQWRRTRVESIDILQLEAQSWMDMDDPQAAFDALRDVRSLKAARYLRTTRAEASRRTGYPETALAYVEDRPSSALEGEGIDAIRARIFVDLGRVEEARAILGDTDTIDDPDLLASAWYLARHDGDAEAVAGLARRYAAVQASPLRDLDQLVPLPSR